MSLLGNLTDGLKDQVAKSGLSNDLLNKGLSFASDAEALKKLLSSDVMQTIGAKLGISIADLEPKITAIVPQLVSTLAKDGKLDLSSINSETLITTVTSLLKN